MVLDYFKNDATKFLLKDADMTPKFYYEHHNKDNTFAWVSITKGFNVTKYSRFYVKKYEKMLISKKIMQIFGRRIHSNKIYDELVDLEPKGNYYVGKADKVFLKGKRTDLFVYYLYDDNRQNGIVIDRETGMPYLATQPKKWQELSQLLKLDVRLLDQVDIQQFHNTIGRSFSDYKGARHKLFAIYKSALNDIIATQQNYTDIERHEDDDVSVYTKQAIDIFKNFSHQYTDYMQSLNNKQKTLDKEAL